MRATDRQPWLVRSRTARITTVVAVLAACGALTATFVSGGGRDSAAAATDLSQYVAIAKVTPNVIVPRARRGASTGRFTVDCGTNGNGKFSPDNPVAQPGIVNGAEHLHDFVGNLAITATTPDADLATAGTTCRNGDRSSYFWPVVRIDDAVRPDAATIGQAVRATVPTVACPRVADRLPAIPQRAKAAVDAQLRALSGPRADAERRLAEARGRLDTAANSAILDSLRNRRATVLRRIGDLIVAAGGQRPANLIGLAECDLSYDALHAGHGAPAPAAAAAAAELTVQCPTVRDRLPGVPAAALAAVDARLAELDRQRSAADQRLVEARGQADPNFVRTTVLGPLTARRSATLSRIATALGLRSRALESLATCTASQAAAPAASPSAPSASSAPSAPAAGSAALPEPQGRDLELPNNTGGIVRPAVVLIEYRGNPTGKVVPMPKFLRELTGDAKPTSRGPANARATWTCSGFTDRLSDKYPICPRGSRVTRVEDFPGCWDGTNIDSANHRSHVAFADQTTGACPATFRAIPQLRITLEYDIARADQVNGRYALDSFPEENHNPFSDHNDFINVNSTRQMQRIATCLNTGRRCS